ncbi:hypothetical protein NGG16_03010 [Enterococcus casseliflavus]|uniref:hypothetical protein n=1 Tax=Enterococcus casseliflavus TaxID=37734 RepID=UPI002DBB52FE|nr:hypothetical protein [Enterococcus casseliflavus]MEB8416404.1 hypothetical protein [Enterococcus casseliflavus]
MTEFRLRNVNDLEWEQFKIYCKKNGTTPTEQLKKYIREATRFEVVVDSELRMKAILDDVIAHLDLNTQAYLLNVKEGILPMVDIGERDSHEVFNQS